MMLNVQLKNLTDARFVDVEFVLNMLDRQATKKGPHSGAAICDNDHQATDHLIQNVIMMMIVELVDVRNDVRQADRDLVLRHMTKNDRLDDIVVLDLDPIHTRRKRANVSDVRRPVDRL